MRRLGLLLCLVSRVGDLRGQACEAGGSLALVLSGGGAKGLAHIGVIRVLDSLGIRPDLVVGTSMGSIVGAMYASGYSGRAMDSLARSLPLPGLFRSLSPRAPEALGGRPILVEWEAGSGRFRLSQTAVHETEVNALLNAGMMRGNLRARGNFDSLPIPFRAVATDLSDRAERLLAEGDLAQAVRASMSIPLVFDPVPLDGRFLGDGALVANIPVAQAHRLGASRVIVSDATEHPSDTLNLAAPLVLFEHLLGFLFTQPPDPLGPSDRLVRPDIDGFTSLDFRPRTVASLLQRGYTAARDSLADFPCHPPRSTPAPRPVAPIVASVEVTGGSSPEQRLVLKQLRLQPGVPLDANRLRDGLRALGQIEEIRSVWLHPYGSGDSVSFRPEIRPASRLLLVSGLVYDSDLGGRMWVGGLDHRFLVQGLTGSAAVGVGELRQDLTLGLRRYRIGARPLQPTVNLLLARERVRRFDVGGAEISAVRTRELVGFAGLELDWGREWRLALGGRLHSWWEAGMGSATATGATLRLRKDPRYTSSAVSLEATWTGAYRSFLASIATRVTVSERVWLEPRLRYGWGRSLPLQSSYRLGGDEGFPGEHIGQALGDREVYGSLGVRVLVLGPVQVGADMVAGKTASGGPAFPKGRFGLGARVGVGVRTPIGPIRVEYGADRDSHDAAFVRVGEWF
jgi:NTE family protein